MNKREATVALEAARGDDVRALLAARIARWTTAGTDLSATAIPGLLVYRREAPTEPMSCMVEASVALVVQGAKRVLLGGDAYNYDTRRFLITSLDLPVVASVIEASPQRPCLGLVFRLDQRVMAELMVQRSLAPPREQPTGPGLILGETTLPLLDAFGRLMALLDEPEGIAALAPLIEREILYRLLVSDQGARLRQIASVGTHGQRIARAIDWLRTHYAQALRIEELAASVQMSPSSFHQHFRSLTAMSPLQFQKWLRLNEARRLMLTEHLDASTAAYQVGYESPSQFSREYGRLFGAPPRRDIEGLRRLPGTGPAILPT